MSEPLIVACLRVALWCFCFAFSGRLQSHIFFLVIRVHWLCVFVFFICVLSLPEILLLLSLLIALVERFVTNTRGLIPKAYTTKEDIMLNMNSQVITTSNYVVETVHLRFTEWIGSRAHINLWIILRHLLFSSIDLFDANCLGCAYFPVYF